MITLALLTLLRHENELAMHLRAGLRNGLDEEETGDVLLHHTSVHAGTPGPRTPPSRAQHVLADDSTAR
jgi:4-carboxymuconolactone decarboxylase